MERIRKQLVALKARLVALLRARDEAARKGISLLEQEEANFKAACEQDAKDLDAELRKLETTTQAARRRTEDRFNRRTTRVKNTCVRLKTAFQNSLKAKLGVLVAKQQAIHEKAAEDRKEKTNALGAEGEVYAEKLKGFDGSLDSLREGLGKLAKDNRVRFGEVKVKESLEHVPGDLEKVRDEISGRISEAEEVLRLCQARFRKRRSSLGIHFVLLLAAVGAWWHFYKFSTLPLPLLIVGGALVICMAMVYAVFSIRKERVYAAGMDLARKLDSIQELTDWMKRELDRRREKSWSELDETYAKRVAAVDAQVQQMTQENKAIYAQITSRLSDARDRLQEKIARDKETDVARVLREKESAVRQRQAAQKETLAKRKQQHEQRKSTVKAEEKQEQARLAEQWKQVLGEFSTFAQETMTTALATCPPWPEVTASNWKLPSEFHDEIRTGEVRMALKGFVPESDPEGPFSIPTDATITLPFVVSFPLEGSLYIRAGQSKREEGMQLLLSSVVRLLCSCPPSRVKLTVVDPVGLGQNFAALMHLADYDESLVNNRIWSDSSHIERKLTDLTEHMETVIQKYLRNRYESIDAYNREAGQLAEPYRFLVIADFPAGFTDAALDRLASIASSGARCGVFTLILHDARQKLPSVTDEKVLRRSGQAIVEQGDGFVVDDPALNRGSFVAEQAPPAEQVDTLLHAVGKQCRDAVRVEVPFEAAAPKPAEYWTSTSEQGIRLPLGKTGADRLQFLELGRGTAQHALIAGKTGSGKSNLFHVIVTNASLWYSPREIEFYLIDFKKGVEFKTYATNQLPHARVIAIESDREFGLSVLRKLDKELVRRGELFREARVQDLASYRKIRPAELMPRSMLIIDEFQEFFTEDDGIGQDAALLMDRIVRQGRAFGIHVILGSQTLGGVYTLAKSTLGQMAVRIALQCNEADSYLILSDDNAAARLLSRPGEAIYNDMSGQIEGNNPFQAVFFPKSSQDKALAAVRQKASQVTVPDELKSVVFEGNSPAELSNNPLLSDRLAKGQGGEKDDTVRIWLGEANAIKGPTEAQITRQAGRNLLIVGQRPDAGYAMCASTILCLAAQHAPEDLRICILDGTPPEAGARERMDQLAAALPHRIEIFQYRDVPQVIEELSTALKSRREGTGTGPRACYLMVLGIQRFRMLRQEDEYNFSSSLDGEAKASPSQNFADLLTEGPSEGFHSIVWCDTLGNLNRAFSRKAVREFELRVLYQMSANDSSELIDSPVANKLGLYNALLFTMQDGAVEKFRPYAAPEPNLIQEIGKTLKSKSPATSG